MQEYGLLCCSTKDGGTLEIIPDIEFTSKYISLRIPHVMEQEFVNAQQERGLNGY